MVVSGWPGARRGGLSETGVDPKQTIAVKIGGVWAVAGALRVRYYAGFHESRGLRSSVLSNSLSEDGSVEGDGDLDT